MNCDIGLRIALQLLLTDRKRLTYTMLNSDNRSHLHLVVHAFKCSSKVDFSAFLNTLYTVLLTLKLLKSLQSICTESVVQEREPTGYDKFTFSAPKTTNLWTRERNH